MQITNTIKNTTLADTVIVAATFLKRTKGLLGREEFRNGESLVIRPCNSIHTFFMKFAIDVLFVDKNSRIVKAVSRLEPFRITPIYFSAHFVVELPAGTIEFSHTQAGDTIRIA